MKTLLVLAMLAQAPDAPKAVTLTPDEAKAHAARVLTCEKDLDDCKASGGVSEKWLIAGIVGGVLTGVALGFAAGAAWKR